MMSPGNFFKRSRRLDLMKRHFLHSRNHTVHPYLSAVSAIAREGFEASTPAKNVTLMKPLIIWTCAVRILSAASTGLV